MLADWPQRILDRRIWLLSGWVLLLAIALAGMPRLGFTTAYDAFFSPQNPEWQAFQAIEEEFSRSQSTFMALAPADGEVFSGDTIAALRDLTERAWSLPYVKSVSSLSNFHHAYAQADELVVEPLLPPGDPARMNLAEVRERISQTPRVQGGLLARDEQVAGVSISYALPEDVKPVVAARQARALAAELEKAYPGHRIYLTGSVMLDEAMMQSMRSDISRLYPAFGLLLFALLSLCFMSSWPVLAVIVVLLGAAGGSFGLAGWAGVVLNTASLASGLIVLTLAVADCVHVLNSYYAADASLSDEAAMRQSLRFNAEPIMLTSLTTALGFLGMNFSGSPPFRDLGNMVAVGVILAWALSMTLLPILVLMLPGRRARRRVVFAGMAQALADFVCRWRRPLLGFGLAAMLLLPAAIPLNRFGDNYLKFFDYSIDFRGDTEFINSRLSGLQLIEYPLRAGGEGDVADPEFLRDLRRLHEWFAQQPEVRRVVDVTELVMRINRAMNGDDPAYSRIPDNRQLIAQYLLFYEMSLPQGVDVTDLVNLEKSVARLAVVLDTIPDQQMLALDQRAQAWMRDNLPSDMQVPGSSISLMFAAIARHNFAGMMLGTVLAFGFIAAVMIFAFRNWRLGLASLLPNCAPILMGFGIWGLWVGQTGVATSVVASLTLGIVVDDTVHLLSKYRRARVHDGLGVEQAVRLSLCRVGPALIITSLALVVGFIVMTFSSFAMTEQMGALTAIIIMLALAFDLLVLPAVLLRVDRDRDAGQ